MLEHEQEPHICFECDAEFVIHTPFDVDDPVSFCPFCGSEIESEDLDEDLDDDDGVLGDYQ
jgi:rRNA maturation endonuclease Nob1